MPLLRRLRRREAAAPPQGGCAAHLPYLMTQLGTLDVDHVGWIFGNNETILALSFLFMTVILCSSTSGLLAAFVISFILTTFQGDAFQRGTGVSLLCCIAFYFYRRVEVLKMFCTLKAPSCKVFNRGVSV
jgi:hypothetical protein